MMALETYFEEQVAKAIRESIQYDRIVTIESEPNEFDGFVARLRSLCDNSVDMTATEGHPMEEFWGVDEEGEDWRVHVQSDATDDQDD